MHLAAFLFTSTAASVVTAVTLGQIHNSCPKNVGKRKRVSSSGLCRPNTDSYAGITVVNRGSTLEPETTTYDVGCIYEYK